jgi:hypothetical protein
MHAHHRIPGALLAVLLAGPIFSAALAAAIAAGKLPGPIAFTETEVTGYLFITLFSIIVGAALAFLPVMLGSLAMSRLGHHWPIFRRPFAWTAAGAVIGASLALLWGTQPEALPGWFAMIVTGTLCARLARCWVVWIPDDQLDRNALTPAVAISACPPK